MNCRSFKEIRKAIEELGPITNKEKLLAALPVLVEACVKIKTMRRTIKLMGELADGLNDACSKYAMEHPSVFVNGKLNVDGKGVQHGDVEVGGKLYHFSSGYKGFIREDGDNITQDFLDGLPEKWVKGKIELDATGMERLGVTDAELQKAGLVRRANNVWSLPETSAAGDDE